MENEEAFNEGFDQGRKYNEDLINKLTENLQILMANDEGQRKMMLEYKKTLASSSTRRSFLNSVLDTLKLESRDTISFLLNSLESIYDEEKSLKNIMIDMETHCFEEQVKTLQIEINECMVIQEKIKKTLQKIENENENENTLYDVKKADTISLNIPKYDGSNENTNIYEHLLAIEEYIYLSKSKGISGLILKASLTGVAKDRMHRVFKVNLNPSYEILKSELIKHFGDVRIIVNSYLIKHRKIGKLTENFLINVEDSLKTINAHLSIINGCTVMFKFAPSDSYNNKDRMITYVDALESYLPTKYCFELSLSTEGHPIEKRFELTHDTFKLIQKMMLKHFKFQTFEISRKKYEMGLPPTFVSEVKSPYSYEDATGCPICKIMISKFNSKPKTTKHLVTRSRDSKRSNVLIESCSFLVNLTVSEKSDFLTKIGFCRICAYKPLSDKHVEGLCKFTEKYAELKCKATNCNQRASFCTVHRFLNKGKLRYTRNLLQKFGIKYTF